LMLRELVFSCICKGASVMQVECCILSGGGERWPSCGTRLVAPRAAFFNRTVREPGNENGVQFLPSDVSMSDVNSLLLLTQASWAEPQTPYP